MSTGTYELEVTQDSRTVLVLTPSKADESQPEELVGVAGVPYFSQWDSNALVMFEGKQFQVDADDVRGDCGPAVLTSIIWKKATARPTVNAVGLVCGQPRVGEGTRYTTHAQLRRGAKGYGLKLTTRSKYRPPIYDLNLIFEELDAGLPSIALGHYGVLADELKKYPQYVQPQDVGYRSGHWFCALRYSLKEGWIEVHDTDFWGTRRSDGDYRRIPLPVFDASIKAISPGCTVGYQGLILR